MIIICIIVPCSIQGAIRLQGGTNTSGRVEICNNGAWGTVCDDFWSAANTQVACRQLGLPVARKTDYISPFLSSLTPAGATALTSGFTNGVGQIWLDDVQCVGTESRLIDCPARPLGQHSCSHSEDAGISCPPIGA